MKKYLLLGLSLILSATLWAQERTVTGTVTDAETGEAVPGANVVEKGTTNGTITDFNGQYKLAVGDGATLVFSFVGYASSEAVVGSRGVIDAALDLDVQSLSEVVVVGYGTQDKKEITSSVASISSEDFNRGTVNDPVQLLQGKVAGLNITKPGGDPNGGYNIRLRGLSTVGANASPLVIIDGVIGGSLSTVDPNDIASMDILKDGSAAAIYGSRGSSGVILVTTKSGTKGKMQVDYNGSYAVESIYNTIDFMTADEYREVPGAQDFGSDTDWMDEVTQLGQAQVHNVSLSGGTGQTSYRISMNYRDTEGIGIGTGFSQLNGRVNVTQRALNDRAKITVGISSTTKESDYGFTEAFRYAVVANPTMPIYLDASAGGLTAQGGYAQRDIFDFFNPVAIAEQNVNEGVDHLLLTSVRAEYDFSDLVEGLSASVFYSRQEENNLRGEYYAKESKFRGAGRNGFARKSNDRRTNELIESTVNYTKDVSDLNIALLGGYSYQEFFNEGSGLEGGNFITDFFKYNNMSSALDFNKGLGNVWSYADSYKLIGFFGRLNLNYDNTFFLSASARYEGSTRFGANNKWGLFPAVSAGANITNLVEIPTVNSLKLRGSFGRTGNIPGSSYLSLFRYDRAGNVFNGGDYTPSYAPFSNSNPDLSWETKDEIDVGVDFALLDNRLSGTFDWYTRTTTDMIFPVSVPIPPNLVGTTDLNIGEFKNSGIELAMNYQAVVTNDFTWTPGFNFATFSTQVVSLTSGDLSFGDGGVLYRANMGAPGQNESELVRVKEGEELGQLWGPVQIGVDEDGTPRFADLSGDGSYCNCDDDRTVIGSGLPDATFGFNNSFTYKNFDLNIFIRGAVGHDLVNSYRGFYENLESTTVGNYNVVKTKYYDPNVKKASVNSVHVESADYVKIDNATLGYNFPMQSGRAVRNLRIYVSAQNPFVLTGYTGVDPEVRYEDRIDSDNGGRPGGADNLSPGIERRSTYFTTRTFTLGLNLGF